MILKPIDNHVYMDNTKYLFVPSFIYVSSAAMLQEQFGIAKNNRISSVSVDKGNGIWKRRKKEAAERVWGHHPQRGLHFKPK
jgi:hypothetical protein